MQKKEIKKIKEIFEIGIMSFLQVGAYLFLTIILFIPLSIWWFFNKKTFEDSVFDTVFKIVGDLE